jgi:hypothetical protein
MRLHFPQPMHGWRALFGEIAIIVVGVLVALGAQQMVETWSWDRKVAATELTMQQEIKNSLLAVAELNRLESCSSVQLDALQDAIIRGDQVKARQILDGGTVFGASRLWADNAFEATLAAQVSDHLGAEKLKRYSQVYQMIRHVRRDQEIAEDPSPELAVLYLASKVPASPERRYAQLREVATIRLQRMSMRARGQTIARYAKNDLGLAVTQSEYLAAPGRTDIINLCEGAAAAEEASARSS